MKLEPKAFIQIQKPIQEVFEGIVNPEIMTKYFINTSTGRLETDKKVIWTFPEFSMEIPVSKVVVTTNKSVSFVWDPETIVLITLEQLPDHSTLVRVTESGKEINDGNL